MNKKRILPAFLTLCLAFSMVLFARAYVSAKSSDGIKIVFNGKKAVALGSESEPETLSRIEGRWGEKTRLAESPEEYAGEAYVWEKGKTFISIREYKESEGGGLGYVMLAVSDKNASVAGVKVGMKKSRAVKKLQGIYGKENVVLLKEGQPAVPDWKPCPEISVRTEAGMPVSFSLKNGRVFRISWMRS